MSPIINTVDMFDVLQQRNMSAEVHCDPVPASAGGNLIKWDMPAWLNHRNRISVQGGIKS